MYDLHKYTNKHIVKATWGRTSVMETYINPPNISKKLQYIYKVNRKHTNVHLWKTYMYLKELFKRSSIHEPQIFHFINCLVRALFTTLSIEFSRWLVQFILHAALSSQGICFQTLTSILGHPYLYLFRVTYGVSPPSKSETRSCLAEQAIVLPQSTRQVTVRRTQMGRLQTQFLHEMAARSALRIGWNDWLALRLSSCVTSMIRYGQISRQLVFAVRHIRPEPEACHSKTMLSQINWCATCHKHRSCSCVQCTEY